MNKYEQYLTTRYRPYRPYSPGGYPVYTRDEAIERAAELPGSNNVRHRILWLDCFPPGSYFESRPDGLYYIREANI